MSNETQQQPTQPASPTALQQQLAAMLSAAVGQQPQLMMQPQAQMQQMQPQMMGGMMPGMMSGMMPQMGAAPAPTGISVRLDLPTQQGEASAYLHFGPEYANPQAIQMLVMQLAQSWPVHLYQRRQQQWGNGGGGGGWNGGGGGNGGSWGNRGGGGGNYGRRW